MLEAHYCSLTSQSNVYGLAKFVMPCGMHKILVSSLRGRVVSVEFQKTKPLSKEVFFTYIPGDAEIVSIDSFNKTYQGNGVVVGITFMKPSPEEKLFFLNIYSEWDGGADYDLDRIAQGCQNLELSFIPYQLYHTKLLHGGETEVVFLLCGSDQKVHLYREDRTVHTFSEHATEEHFPELDQLTSIITWMECRYLEDDRKRLTAFGCLTGAISVCLVETQTREILERWHIDHDSPITSVQLFTLYNDLECPSFLSQVLEPGQYEDLAEFEQQPEISLLVTSAVEVSVVYRNVLEKGLQDVLLLGNSECYDSTLCTLVADIDFDGQNEILLGTYGQELLAFKFHQKKPYSRNSTYDARGVNQGQDSSASNCTLSTDSPRESPCKVQNGREDVGSLGTDTGKDTSGACGAESRVRSTSETGGPSMESGRTPCPHGAEGDGGSEGNQAQIHPGDTDGANHEVRECRSMSSDVSHDFKPGTPGTPSHVAVNLDRESPDAVPMGQVSDRADTSGCSTQSALSRSSICDGDFSLMWHRDFGDPILALDEVDLTGDGLNEIILVSLKGVHVLQHNLEETAHLCMDRMKQISDHPVQQEDVFNQLLSENLS